MEIIRRSFPKRRKTKISSSVMKGFVVHYDLLFLFIQMNSESALSSSTRFHSSFVTASKNSKMSTFVFESGSFFTRPSHRLYRELRRGALRMLIGHRPQN